MVDISHANVRNFWRILSATVLIDHPILWNVKSCQPVITHRRFGIEFCLGCLTIMMEALQSTLSVSAEIIPCAVRTTYSCSLDI